jgi:L-aminopeptidase/D-esterase-like protein
VFALAIDSGDAGGDVDPETLARLGSAAATCLARAIMRALIEAAPLGGYPSWRQRWGSGGR